MSYQIKNVALTALNQAKLGEFHMATATQAAETGFNESIATLYARYKALCTTYSTLLKGSYGSDFTTTMPRLRRFPLVSPFIPSSGCRSPFEDYDPERGTRYVGNEPIPWDAPPRPDSRSLWDDDDKQWVSPEVLDEKRAAGIARLEAMMAKHPLMTS